MHAWKNNKKRKKSLKNKNLFNLKVVLNIFSSSRFFVFLEYIYGQIVLDPFIFTISITFATPFPLTYTENKINVYIFLISLKPSAYHYYCCCCVVYLLDSCCGQNNDTFIFLKFQVMREKNLINDSCNAKSFRNSSCFLLCFIFEV